MDALIIEMEKLLASDRNGCDVQDIIGKKKLHVPTYLLLSQHILFEIHFKLINTFIIYLLLISYYLLF